jgi:membrane protease YdiL (CAAX protease family)
MNPDENNPLPSAISRSSEPQGSAESAPMSAPAALSPDYSQPAEPMLAPDLQVPWGWFDLLVLAILYLVGGILLARFLVRGFGIAGVSPSQLQQSVSEQSFFAIVVELLLDGALLAYLVAQVRLHFGLPFWRTIGWRRLETGTTPRGLAYLGLLGGGLLFSMMIQLSSAAFAPKTKLPIENFFQDRRSAILLMLMAVLVAPVIEETIFRGYVYPVVARTFGVTGGILVTGTIFGLLHAAQLWGGWGQIGLLILVGIVFTAVRASTRTVVASYLLHVSYNSFIFLAFVIASHGFRNFPAGH